MGPDVSLKAGDTSLTAPAAQPRKCSHTWSGYNKAESVWSIS